MPLVDSSERHFAVLVVCLDALEDLHHRLLPLSPAVCSAGHSCPAGQVVEWEANPSLEGKAGSGPRPSSRSDLSRVLLASYTMKRRLQGWYGLWTLAPRFTRKDKLLRTLLL